MDRDRYEEYVRMEQLLEELYDNVNDKRRTYEYYQLITGGVMKYCSETGQFYLLDRKSEVWHERPELETCYYGNYLNEGRITEFDDIFPIQEEP